MAEEKPEIKSDKVRVSGRLLKKLRLEESTYTSQGKAAPAYGDMLEHAWEVFERGRLVGLRTGTQNYDASIPQNDNVVIPPSEGSTITAPGSSKESGLNSTPKALESLVLLSEILESDVPWVRKLLQILHGQKEVARGIQINIDQFTLARELSEGHTVPGSLAPAIQPGRTALGSDEGLSLAPAVRGGDKEQGAQPAARAGGATEIEEKLQKLQKVVAHGKRRDDKKPRRKRNVG